MALSAGFAALQERKPKLGAATLSGGSDAVSTSSLSCRMRVLTCGIRGAGLADEWVPPVHS
jgi:hypothetical protein